MNGDLAKLASRKFLVFILNFISLIALALLGKIEGVYIVLGLLLNGLLYIAVEGAIDLRRLAKFSAGGVSVEQRDERKAK